MDSDQPPTSGQPRTYRRLHRATDLVEFSVALGESDLHISARTDLSALASETLERLRADLVAYIRVQPGFASTLVPLDAASDAPQIVRLMCEASAPAGVGPMATVAGAVADLVGRELLSYSPEVIVENGGDIFLASRTARRVAIFADQSPFSLKVAVQVPPCPGGLGICTSSGTVGHSLSFGRADAATTLADTAAVADAWATALGNLVQSQADVQIALDRAASSGVLRGAVIVIGGTMGAWGQVELVPLTP